MATDRKNTNKENSQVSKILGIIDSIFTKKPIPQYQYPHNSRLDYYTSVETDEYGFPVNFDEEAIAYRNVIRKLHYSAYRLRSNPNWTALLNHYPIEGFDKVLPKSPYYNPLISITEYIAYAAYIYGLRYIRDITDFYRLDLTIAFLEQLLGNKIGLHSENSNLSDPTPWGKPVVHLILIIVEYFRMRQEYNHFHPSRIAKEDKDEAYFNDQRDKDFKENPEVKELWDNCIAVAGEPKAVSLSRSLHEKVFDPIYYDFLLDVSSLFGSWHGVLIRPIRQIVEKLFAEHIEAGPYRQIYRSLKFGASFFDGGLTNQRIIGNFRHREDLQLTKELNLAIIFFKMCCMNDNRRHVIKYYMQESTKSLVQDLEEVIEIILKYKDDPIYTKIDKYQDIHEFVKTLKASYYLSHLDEEIEQDKPSLYAFDQPGEILIAPDFNDIPDWFVSQFQPLVEDIDYYRKALYDLIPLDWEIEQDKPSLSAFDQLSDILIAPDFINIPDWDVSQFQPLVEDIAYNKGTYRCPFEITEPFYYEFDLDYSSCLGDFEDNFYERYAAIDKDRRSLEIRFSELVNWFAQNGVIKNELKVLNLFAYRLTGMGEKPKELPKIEIPIKIDASHKEAYWTLIYLAKTLYQKNISRNKDPQNRGVYPKLADFFVVTDPEHPEVAEKIQQDFYNIVNSSTVDGKQKNPSALVKGKVPDSLVKLIKDNFGLPQK